MDRPRCHRFHPRCQQRIVRACQHDSVGPGDTVIDERRADLLIMGAYSHSSVWRFLRGSRTTQLLHKTEVPMLLLR